MTFFIILIVGFFLFFILMNRPKQSQADLNEAPRGFCPPHKWRYLSDILKEKPSSLREIVVYNKLKSDYENNLLKDKLICIECGLTPSLQRRGE